MSGAAYGSRSEHSDWLPTHRSIYIRIYSSDAMDILYRYIDNNHEGLVSFSYEL